MDQILSTIRHSIRTSDKDRLVLSLNELNQNPHVTSEKIDKLYSVFLNFANGQQNEEIINSILYQYGLMIDKTNSDELYTQIFGLCTLLHSNRADDEVLATTMKLLDLSPAIILDVLRSRFITEFVGGAVHRLMRYYNPEDIGEESLMDLIRRGMGFTRDDMETTPNGEFVESLIDYVLQIRTLYAEKPSWIIERYDEKVEIPPPIESLEDIQLPSDDDKILDLLTFGVGSTSNEHPLVINEGRIHYRLMLKYLRNPTDANLKLLPQAFVDTVNELLPRLGNADDVIRWLLLENDSVNDLRNLSMANNEAVYHQYGPLNFRGNRVSDACRSTGGCRMLSCECFDTNPEYDPDFTIDAFDWFVGHCIYNACLRLIEKKHYAVRQPEPGGGWSGCYCSWQCAELDYVLKNQSYLFPTTIEKIYIFREELNDVKQMDKKIFDR
jgi:hypothetical protein